MGRANKSWEFWQSEKGLLSCLKAWPRQMHGANHLDFAIHLQGEDTMENRSVQSQDPRVVLAWAGVQESPYCSLWYCFPALPWASHCCFCCPPLSDLCCGEDWSHHCQTQSSSTCSCRELSLHSSCLHHVSLLKRKADQYAYLKCGWKKYIYPVETDLNSVDYLVPCM